MSNQAQTPKLKAPTLEIKPVVPFSYTGRTVVVVHIYDEQIWYDSIQPRLAETLDGRCDYDLYISITKRDNLDLIADSIRKVYPNAVIVPVENVGEDVNGFMHCVKAIEDSGKDYDYMLKLHTKSNVAWRNSLLDGALPKNCDRLNALLDNGEAMIGSLRWIRTFPDALNHIGGILEKIGCKRYPMRFVGGTMFWVRFDIIKKYLFGGKLPVDYFDEAYKRVGLKQHAMERVFGMMVSDSGGAIVGL